jgi:PAS domain S-box-containing protein
MPSAGPAEVRALSAEVTGLIASLNASELSYHHLFDQHPAPMWLYDERTLAFLAVNDAAIAMYGYSREEFLAMTIEQIRPPEDIEALHLATADEGRAYVDAGIWRHQKKDGTVIEVEISSNAVEFGGDPARAVLARDVTVQRQLEEQLRQAQKMEAIGRLAGGVAHDFNNLLLVIRGYGATLLEGLTDEKLRRSALQIDSAAQRGAEFTHQLLAFSRQQVLHPAVINPNEVVDETVNLVRRMLREDIALEVDLEPDIGAILVDRGQLGQVMLNLLVNAREAMPHGGSLSVRTATVELGENYSSEHVGVVPGSYVLLQVTDTGAGMDEETRSRIFDPFFTTKEGGTGLGLASVQGIVVQSGGHVWVYSEPGLGTNFKIYFPVAESSVVTAPEAPETGSLEGKETILLVEDSEIVRELVTESLESYGYTVLPASSGVEAVKIVERNGHHIDLLLTDVVMPNMNGRELAERLVAKDGNLKVLYTSGYPSDMILRNGISGSSTAFIEKPYLPVELARTIRTVLRG